MLTNENLRHLDHRAAVPAVTLDLLRRAQGLELLQPEEFAGYITKTQHPNIGLKRGESSAGYDFDAPTIADAHVVLVCEEVFYPIAGYPEAYERHDPAYSHRMDGTW